MHGAHACTGPMLHAWYSTASFACLVLYCVPMHAWYSTASRMFARNRIAATTCSLSGTVRGGGGGGRKPGQIDVEAIGPGATAARPARLPAASATQRLPRREDDRVEARADRCARGGQTAVDRAPRCGRLVTRSVGDAVSWWRGQLVARRLVTRSVGGAVDEQLVHGARLRIAC